MSHTAMNLLTLLKALPGARLVGDVSTPVQRVHTDTRTLQPGDLFVALKGERFDAHTFLNQAAAKGAVMVLAEHGVQASGLPGAEVPDSRWALGELAKAWRTQWHGPLIAVTGSNGKTTVTQMIAAILRAASHDQAHATQGNLNNDIGVPLTVLRLRPHHRRSVVELGMNHPGEMARLCAIAQPTVALVNNAQREHQEFMGTVEAVAQENGVALTALPADGVAVFPAHDPYTALWRDLSGARRIWVFDDERTDADVHATQVRWLGDHWAFHLVTPMGQMPIALRVAGRHNVRNALAAAACALAAGVSLAHVQAGLGAFEPVGGRSRALGLLLPRGRVTVVDDTYNANPDSVLAAIRVLAELPAPRCLVLGDMGEVGEQGLAFHLEVLRHAQAAGLTDVHVSGPWMVQAVAELSRLGQTVPRLWSDVDTLAAHLASTAPEATGPQSVLVKGSRFMRMERVVQALMALPSQHISTETPHVA
ncbi:MAG: UDP-N-acetylmuramoyl-tripeptide--D-alanyl-D-alanine ligase [Pseudomonadota bacterium]|jgi:UDP-N-acetylmuramoyl-tripeptide--D-alanyl-D-alanine ligase